MNRMVSCALALLSFVSLGAASLIVIGSLWYGGPENLTQRVRLEIGTRRLQATFSPTPPATATGVAAVFTPAEYEEETLPAHSEGLETPLPAWPSSETPVALQPSPTASPTPTGEVTRSFAQRAWPMETPTATPRPTSTPTATPTPAYTPLLPRVQLSGITHMWQTWNNCGPATLAMHLSYYGSSVTQADVAAALRFDKDDKNVSPEELAGFACSQGFHAIVRVNGDGHRLRLLLSNGIPVLIESWHEPEPDNGMGHYRLLTGYDEATQEWIAYDSYDYRGVDFSKPYAGIRLPYDEVDRLWAVFNRPYVVIYTDSFEPAVQSILGEEMDDAIMWQHALNSSQTEVQQRPHDPFAWFNLGTDWLALGQFDEAAAAYDRARQIGLPWRMLWYQFGPFRAYYEVGRYDEVIALADETLKKAKTVEELYYWKGLALQALGNIVEAKKMWQQALALNPRYTAAAAALSGGSGTGSLPMRCRGH